jgi:hypothetical protein
MKGVNFSLPFYAIAVEPIITYVIDNELIGFENFEEPELFKGAMLFSPYELHSGYNNSAPAFLILEYLFQFKEFRAVVPKQFHQFLDKNNNVASDPFTIQLISILSDDEETYSLMVTVERNKDNPDQVRFYDFYYKNKKLPNELTISFKEAFQLLSNLVVSAHIRGIMDVDLGNEEESVKKIIHNKITRMTEIEIRYQHLYQFVSEYLLNLYSEINSQKCDLKQLLQFNGAPIIAYFAEIGIVREFIEKILIDINSENLTVNQQFLHLILIELLQSRTDFGVYVEQFREDNRQRLLSIRKQLKKEFPMKLEETEIGEYLPLFLQQVDPTCVYVIDNNLLGYTEYGGRDQYPYRAFYHIQELYNNNIARNGIPSRLHRCLEKVSYNPNREMSNFDMLLGEQSYGRHKLELSLKFQNKQNAEVLIENILYSGMNLNLSYSLSKDEAFLIFANITTNGSFYSFGNLVQQNNHQLISNQQLEDYFVERIEKGKKYPGAGITEEGKHLMYFVLEYLRYLLEETKANRISLYDILKFNGVQVLYNLAGYEHVQSFILECLEKLVNFEGLSRNEKIMYFTLVRFNEGPKELAKKINEFFNKNRHLMTLLTETLEYEFPNSYRDLIQRNYPSTIQKDDEEVDGNAEILSIVRDDFENFINQSIKLPFFVHSGKKAIVVLNNKLIGNASIASPEIGSIVPHSFLQEMYKSEKVRKIIPKELLESFDYESDYFSSEIFECLFGMAFGDNNTCFKVLLNMPLENDEVSLIDFSYANTSIDHKVALSTEDAFYTFANLLCEGLAPQISQLLSRHNKKLSDAEFLKKQISKDYVQLKEVTKKKHPVINSLFFSIDYLNFLVDRIKEGVISPFYILQRCGLKTLVHLCELPQIQSMILNILEKIKKPKSLDFNQKLLCYTLIEELSFDCKVGSALRDFYIENKKVMDELSSELRKSFPLSTKRETIVSKMNFDFIPPATKISQNNFWEIIDEIRKQEIKILLIKEERMLDVANAIQKLLANGKLDYHSLNVGRIINDLLDARDIQSPLQPFNNDKIDIDPLPTLEEITKHIKYQFQKEQFHVDKTTGNKIPIHVSEVSPEKEDLVAVSGLFEFNISMINLEDSINKRIVEAIFELSKDKVLILPHPAVEQNQDMVRIYGDAYFETYDLIVTYSKEFLQKARVITYTQI